MGKAKNISWIIIYLISVQEASGKRGSNPRPSAWEADVLPLNYSRIVGAKIKIILDYTILDLRFFSMMPSQKLVNIKTRNEKRPDSARPFSLLSNTI